MADAEVNELDATYRRVHSHYMRMLSDLPPPWHSGAPLPPDAPC